MKGHPARRIAVKSVGPLLQGKHVKTGEIGECLTLLTEEGELILLTMSADVAHEMYHSFEERFCS